MKWLNKIYRLKNKYREREDYFEVVLLNPDTNEEVVTLIDKDDFLVVNEHSWSTSGDYVANEHRTYLHRLILQMHQEK